MKDRLVRRGLVVEELGGGEERRNSRGSLDRESPGGIGAGCKGVGPMVEHELGVGRGCCLDAQVAEHCVRFPAPQQHDGIGAHIGTEQGGGPAGPEGLSAYVLGVDAGRLLNGGGGMPESILDVLGRSGLPALVGGMKVVVMMEWGFGGGAPLLEAVGNAA